MFLLTGFWEGLWSDYATLVRRGMASWTAVEAHGFPPGGTEEVLFQILGLELVALVLAALAWHFLTRHRPAPSRTRQAWRALLAALGFLLVCFLVLEAALRSHVAHRPPATFIPHPYYLYRGNPNQTVRFLYPLPIRLNSMGLREREIPLTKGPDEFRILVTGDSNAFGQGVPVESTWPRRMEALLQERHPDRRITVINQSMPGYSLAQSWYLYQEIGSRYHPDLLVVGSHGWTARPESADLRRYLAEIPPLRSLHVLLYRSMTYLTLRKELARLRAHRTGQAPPEFNRPTQDPRECARFLERFLGEVRTRNMAALFVAPSPPDREKPLDMWRSRELRPLLESAGPDEPIRFTEWLRTLPREQWTLSASDQHFNEAGHESIARQFADAILEGRLIERP